MQTWDNQLVICTGLFLAFICAAPVMWYTLNKVGMTGTGISGFTVLSTDTLTWLRLVVSAFGTVIVAMNTSQITRISC